MNTQCEGCLLLENGMGGENQLAHMFPGGCLYEEEDYFTESLVNEKTELKLEEKVLKQLAIENTEFLNKNESKICIICKDKFNNIKQTFVCDDCENKEEKNRHLRNQSFNFNKYQNV